MTDLALAWDNDAFAADLLLSGGELVTDDGMRTAILISLFTDARAPAGAQLPEDGADRRGWWGDAFPPEGQFPQDPAEDARGLGSLLWLYTRSKVLPRIIQGARQAAYDALAWLVRDGVASKLTVEVEAIRSVGSSAWLAIGVILDRPNGPGRQRWDFTWNASTGEIGS